ncbi:MAG: hypothetical protein ABJN96_05315 [Marinomonas sp.]
MWSAEAHRDFIAYIFIGIVFFTPIYGVYKGALWLYDKPYSEIVFEKVSELRAEYFPPSEEEIQIFSDFVETYIENFQFMTPNKLSLHNKEDLYTVITTYNDAKLYRILDGKRSQVTFKEKKFRSSSTRVFRFNEETVFDFTDRWQYELSLPEYIMVFDHYGRLLKASRNEK